VRRGEWFADPRGEWFPDPIARVRAASAHRLLITASTSGICSFRRGSGCPAKHVGNGGIPMQTDQCHDRPSALVWRTRASHLACDHGQFLAQARPERAVSRARQRLSRLPYCDAHMPSPLFASAKGIVPSHRIGPELGPWASVWGISTTQAVLVVPVPQRARAVFLSAQKSQAI